MKQYCTFTPSLITDYQSIIYLPANLSQNPQRIPCKWKKF